MPLREYRVQKVTPDGECIEEHRITAASPEEAARELFPVPLSRGQKGYRGVLKAKVYVPGRGDGPVTLVRLYDRETGLPQSGAEA